MVDRLIIARIVAAVGDASSQAYRSYYRSRPLRYLAWRAEHRHALSFVSPEDWDELDLDLLIERSHEVQEPSYPAALGRQLWVVLDAAKSAEIASEANRALEVADSGESAISRLGLTATIESLHRLARPIVRYAPTADVSRLLDAAAQLDPERAESLAATIDQASRQLWDLAASSSASQTPVLNAVGESEGEVPPQDTWSGPGPGPIATGTHVNVGLVHGHQPRKQIDAATLRPNTLYWLWVGVGPRVDEALSGRSDPVAAEALAGATQVDVALFPDPKLEVSPATPWGTLAVSAEGAFPVIRPAADLTVDEAGDAVDQRLFFGVRTPAAPGQYRIRCGVFVRGLLVHVEQVTLPVGTRTGVLSVSTTFRMAKELTPQSLGAVAEHRLSMYVNADADGSHSFTFFGREGDQRYAETVNLDGNNIRVMLGGARQALQAASWQGGGEYKKGYSNRYEPISPGDPFAPIATLERDLVALAVAGRRLWLAFTEKLTDRDPRIVREFQNIMQSPGLVQLAPKEDPDLLVPLQLMYDRPIFTTAPQEVKLCSNSERWLRDPQGGLPCLDTQCPQFGDQTRVCPAGFWGFRHSISVTLVRKTDCGVSALPTSIVVSDKPAVLAGLTTDPEVARYTQAHVEALERIFDVTEEHDFNGVSTALRQCKANIVYFLCHLRYDGAVPVLVVGPQDGPGIDAPILLDLAPNLCQGQPLVFMNACQSAAASPDRLLGLIDHFFQHGASTAIGTEITVFASLAVPFAERLLTEFANDVAIGEAIRRARVAMLAARNPLGLAYLAFGLPQFALQPST